MTTILIVIHVIVSLFLICIVLLQHGKGADIGATFGGSSQSLFGTEGPLPLLNKITTGAAIVFMTTSVTLAYISAHKSSGSVMSNMPVALEQKEQQTQQGLPTAAPPSVPPTPEAAAAQNTTSTTPATPKADTADDASAPAEKKDQQTQKQAEASVPPSAAPAATAVSPVREESAAPQPQEKQ